MNGIFRTARHAMFLLMALLPGFGQAQELRQALIIRAAPGFPDDIARIDPVESAVVHGTWKPPALGERIRLADTLEGVWESVTADSLGWYDHPWLTGAYVYVRVDAESAATMLLAGHGHAMVYVNGVPRSGNPYGSKDTYEAWEPRFDYSLIPVRLHRGRNDLLFSCSRGRFKASLIAPRSPVSLNARDLTLPDVITPGGFDAPGSIVVINATESPVASLRISASAVGGRTVERDVPPMLPLSVRKVPFAIAGEAPRERGTLPLRLELRSSSGLLDSATIPLRVVTHAEPRKETFVSEIDGSVQYYAVNPASAGEGTPALVLSLHGAAVEAINQASAYAAKSWAHILSPTNRRPYGFNWEDWGRLDAMEAFQTFRRRTAVDPRRVYLTGHSMGGHGTYHVALMFPGEFAAAGPSAGWISFWTYRVRQRIENPSPVRRMLMRATLPSDTYALLPNLASMGVYVLHGSDDDNVPVGQSRSMADSLRLFHSDFLYHEQPKAGHWWDVSDEPGADCVDWPPLFDFFARHALPQGKEIRTVEFRTASPGVSHRSHWLSIEGQIRHLVMSRARIQADPLSRKFSGETDNVARLALDPGVLQGAGPVALLLDGQRLDSLHVGAPGAQILLSRETGAWRQLREVDRRSKNPLRYGTFKDAFRNRVVLVYGTHGTAEENRWAMEKARFDAERFWYQGNGSMDVVPDREFDPRIEKDRNVVLYGNAKTNSAWDQVLQDCPVRVSPGDVVMGGERTFTGDDLACLVIYPRRGSEVASVGVVAGTGIRGMKACTRLPYLMPGVGFPDLLILRSSVLALGERGIESAGFFGLDWSLSQGEFVGGR